MPCHNIVKGYCDAIVERMSSEFLKVPLSDAEWLEISKKFEEKWNYPHALGAIDGKHVRIQKPKNADHSTTLTNILIQSF